MSIEDKVFKLIERLAEAEVLLEEVFYWDTCPRDMKEQIMKICKTADLTLDEENTEDI